MPRIFSYLLIALFCFNTLDSVGQEQNLDDIIDSLLNKTEDLSDSVRIVSMLEFSSRSRYNAKVKPLIEESLRLSKLHDDNYQKALALNYYGLYYNFNAGPDSALIFLNQALEFNLKGSEQLLTAGIYSAIGSVYSNQGEIPQGIEQILMAKKIIERIDSSGYSTIEKTKMIGKYAIINNSLANSYQKIEAYEDALIHYDNCYKSFLSINNSGFAGSILSNKGDLLIKMDRLEDALTTLKEARDLKVEGKSRPRSIAYSDLNLGIVNAKLQQYKIAEAYLHVAARSFDELNDQSGIMYVMIEQGLLDIKLNRFGSAIKKCSKGKAMAIAIKDNEYNMKACDCLYQAYKNKGDDKNALANYLELDMLQDSTFNEKNVKKLTQLEMQFEFDKERELQAIVSAAKKRQNRNTIFSLGGLLTLMALVAFLLFRGFSNSRKSERALSEKNKIISSALSEKEVLLKEIHHRVKNNLQVISSLLRIQSRHISDTNALEAIKEGRNRVESMALIHKNLYQEGELIGVDLPMYIDKLSNSLLRNYNLNDKIQLTTDIDPLELDVDMVIPIGLILNELISNALKYAFESNNEGLIQISLKEKEGDIHLSVQDDGVGFPEEFKIEESKSMGFTLIQSFTRKLEATVNITNINGAFVEIIIPKEVRTAIG